MNKTCCAICLVMIICFCACKPRKSGGSADKKSKGKHQYYLVDNCIADSSKYTEAVQEGKPVNLWLKIDKITYNDKKVSVQKEMNMVLYKETGLLVVADSFAVKFFYMEGVEYGKARHFLRWDFLVRTETCWNIVTGSSFQPINMASQSKQLMSKSSSSMSSEKGEMYFEIDWLYGIVAP